MLCDVGDGLAVEKRHFVDAGALVMPVVGCPAQDHAVQSAMGVCIGIPHLAVQYLVIPFGECLPVGGHQTVVRIALLIVDAVAPP